jgi:hypothetical protein
MSVRQLIITDSTNPDFGKIAPVYIPNSSHPPTKGSTQIFKGVIINPAGGSFILSPFRTIYPNTDNQPPNCIQTVSIVGAFAGDPLGSNLLSFNIPNRQSYDNMKISINLDICIVASYNPAQVFPENFNELNLQIFCKLKNQLIDPAEYYLNEPPPTTFYENDGTTQIGTQMIQVPQIIKVYRVGEVANTPEGLSQVYYYTGSGIFEDTIPLNLIKPSGYYDNINVELWGGIIRPYNTPSNITPPPDEPLGELIQIVSGERADVTLVNQGSINYKMIIELGN